MGPGGYVRDTSYLKERNFLNLYNHCCNLLCVRVRSTTGIYKVRYTVRYSFILVG